MVNLNPVENLNIVPDQNFANHVPQFANRNPITPVQFLHNPNAYDSRNNQAKRSHPLLAPSSGSSAESYLKSRNTSSPFYIHNEAATKYAMISALAIKSKDIKAREMMVA